MSGEACCLARCERPAELVFMTLNAAQVRERWTACHWHVAQVRRVLGTSIVATEKITRKEGNA